MDVSVAAVNLVSWYRLIMAQYSMVCTKAEKPDMHRETLHISLILHNILMTHKRVTFHSVLIKASAILNLDLRVFEVCLTFQHSSISDDVVGHKLEKFNFRSILEQITSLAHSYCLFPLKGL